MGVVELEVWVRGLEGGGFGGEDLLEVCGGMISGVSFGVWRRFFLVVMGLTTVRVLCCWCRWHLAAYRVMVTGRHDDELNRKMGQK